MAVGKWAFVPTVKKKHSTESLGLREPQFSSLAFPQQSFVLSYCRWWQTSEFSSRYSPAVFSSSLGGSAAEVSLEILFSDFLLSWWLASRAFACCKNWIISWFGPGIGWGFSKFFTRRSGLSRYSNHDVVAGEAGLDPGFRNSGVAIMYHGLQYR